MTHTVTAADSMWLSHDFNTEELSAALEFDYWSLAAMPLTPPSSFDEMPHRPDVDHSMAQQMDLPPGSGIDLMKTANATPPHTAGTMDVMADDAQLFEHALMAMRRDQHTYHIEETRSRSLEIRTKPRKDSIVQKVKPIKKRQSRARNAQTNGAVRPPALAATHPALYKAPSTPQHPKLQHQTMLPTPPPETQHEPKNLPSPKSMPPPPPTIGTPPWKVYTDPNKLISAQPQFDDPMYRMLKMDVNPDQPNVVSPLFMIGMPCGSLVEAANYYGDDEMQA